MPIVTADPLRGRPREASRIPAPTSAVLTEQFAQSFEENPIAAGKRWYDLERQKAFGKRIDSTSAREQLQVAGLEADLTVDDAGITQDALDTLMWRKRIEKRRQDVFSRAEGGIGQGAARLGVAAATTLADPISAGLNFVPVVGQARYARWLNQARGLGGRVAVRAGVGAAEGAAGAAIVEPLIYGSRTAEQADYDAVDSLANVAFGGLLGTAMHTSVGTLGEVFARSRPSVTTATPRSVGTAPTAVRQRIEPTFDSAGDIARAMKPEDFQATVRAAVGQAIEGRPIDVEGIISAAEVRRPNPVASERDIAAIPELAGLPPVPDGSVRFYHGGDEYNGGSRWLTEDPKYALGYAQREGRTGARLHYVDVPEKVLAERGINKSYVDDGLSQRAPYVHWDAPEEIARELRDVGASASAVATRAADTASPNAQRPRMAARSNMATVDAERAELTAYADETIELDTASRTDSEEALAAIKEEETFATQQLTELYDRLGRELKSAEYDEVIEAAVNAERWSRTAELATVCLTSGRT